MTDRERFALTVLASRDNYVEAAVVGAEDWRQAHASNDDERVRRHRLAKNPNIGWGHTLSALSRKGLALRKFSEFTATWTYAISHAGREALRNAQ